ncbi:ComF family protein [Oceanibium sediminis]|uniref:ComF family protein n=1 Tax=Oceanibium sediminis TaxID=2026339 RepID=UPI001E4D1FB5|nr:ComF family protein [Oceanibium sediminis]
MPISRDALVTLLFPPECAGCRAPTTAAHGLCASCWTQTRFITGPVCDGCGQPLPTAAPGVAVRCEGCTSHPPAWDRGRAAILYEGRGRDIVLSLKHRDRQDLTPVLARWLHRAGRELIGDADILTPVPLHWTRLAKRRFNQSAELARRPELGFAGLVLPDLLTRARATASLKGRTRGERQAILRDAIRLTPRHAARVQGKSVLLLDDVMTTGATLSAAAEALRAGGARHIAVLVVARVAKEGFNPI